MNTQYETDGFICHSEEDVFNKGCQPDTSKSWFSNQRFTDQTLSGLVQQLKDTFNPLGDNMDILLNSCEEDGRIDIQVLEDEDGCYARSSEIEKWKIGQKRLWLSTYSFQVEKVTRHKFKLPTQLKLES